MYSFKNTYIWLPILIVIIASIHLIESKSVGFHSDVIQTKYGSMDEEETNKPGWMRRQLMRFGQMASNIGNSLGKHTTIVTNAVDKVCEVVKTVIPLLSAVCHVGQFKFCAATESAPDNLASALNPVVDLNIPD